MGTSRILCIPNIEKTLKNVPAHTIHETDNVREAKDTKTLRISEDIHQKLTALLGELMAQTSKMQTYQDAINALINESVILPQELLVEIQSFIDENKHLGFTTKEEFIRDAIRLRLSRLSQEKEYVEIQKEQYDLLDEAVREMNTPYRSADGFINAQVRDVLEKYEEWKQAKKRQ
jgi:Arc/MetJ-type ribon-helix-helix transcriptional regulator